MEENIKNTKGKTFALIIMMVAVIFLAGYIVTNRIINKPKTKTMKNDDTQEISLDDKGKELINLVNIQSYSEEIDSSEVGYLVNYFYECKDKIIVSDIQEDYLIDFIYRKIKKKYAIVTENEVYNEVVDAEIIKDNFLKVFGKNVTFDYQDSSMIPEIKYNIFDNKYYVTYNSKGVNISNINRKILKVESDASNIYVYEKAAFIFEDDMTGKVDLYKDYLLNELIISNIDKTNTFDYIDKLNTYKYTFNKDTDNEYYFYSIELID